MSATHIVPANTITNALQAAGYKAFDFDVIDKVGKLHSTPLRTSLLRKIAFACDAYINGAIQVAFSKLRVEMEGAGEHRWDTYQAFLAWASGLAASTELMAEAGMDVKDVREQVQKLYNCRTQCWDLLEHGEMPNPAKPFERPLITEWLRNPRMRSDDPETSAKIMQSVRDEVMDDDGVIDVDMQQIVLESLELKNEATKREALKWDKRRGELSAMFFEALKIRDDVADQGFAGDHEEPFLELGDVHQYKLVAAIPRYISTALTRELANDRKVTIAEHAKASIEARPLRKEAKLAAEHPKFKKAIEQIAG